MQTDSARGSAASGGWRGRYSSAPLPRGRKPLSWIAPTERGRSVPISCWIRAIDPLLPRNAIMPGRRLIDYSLRTNRPFGLELEADGYLGTCIAEASSRAARCVREVSRTAPPFFKSVLGGADTLRGFRAGTAVGDTMVATSAELRIPLTSPLHVAKFGTSVFIDAGTAYDRAPAPPRSADPQKE